MGKRSESIYCFLPWNEKNGKNNSNPQKINQKTGAKKIPALFSRDKNMLLKECLSAYRLVHQGSRLAQQDSGLHF